MKINERVNFTLKKQTPSFTLLEVKLGVCFLMYRYSVFVAVREALSIFDEDAISAVEGFTGGYCLHPFTVFPFSFVAYGVAASVPRFDADKRAVGMSYGRRP